MKSPKPKTPRSLPPGSSPVKLTRAEAIAAAAEDPEILRRYVVQEGAPVWMTGLISSLKPRVPCAECGQVRYERWAYRLWAEIAKLVGIPPNVQVLIHNQIGMTINEARDVAPLAREARDMSPAERYDICKQYIRWYDTEGPGAFVEAANETSGEPAVDPQG